MVRAKRSMTIGLMSSTAVAVGSGPGIPSDKLKRVFDTFYTTKQQATGLGLSIARTIAQSSSCLIAGARSRRGAPEP